jgi:hypothetical protein
MPWPANAQTPITALACLGLGSYNRRLNRACCAVLTWTSVGCHVPQQLAWPHQCFPVPRVAESWTRLDCLLCVSWACPVTDLFCLGLTWPKHGLGWSRARLGLVWPRYGLAFARSDVSILWVGHSPASLPSFLARASLNVVWPEHELPSS